MSYYISLSCKTLLLCIISRFTLIYSFNLRFRDDKMIFSNYLPANSLDIMREETMTYFIKEAFNQSQIHELITSYSCPVFYNVHVGDSDEVMMNHSRSKGLYLMASTNTSEIRPYVGPDWTFIHFPGIGDVNFYAEAQVILNASYTIPPIQKVAWFGNIYSPLPERLEFYTRPLLVNFTILYPDLFDMQHTLWSPKLSPLTYTTLKSLVERYAYLLDIGGNGYSGRLKYLMFSNRPLLLVDRMYKEFFYYELIPYYHYIPVNVNLTDLLTQTLWIRDHPIEAKRIAKQAQDYAIANFTREKIYHEVRQVFIKQCRPGQQLDMNTKHDHRTVKVNGLEKEIDNLMKALDVVVVSSAHHSLDQHISQGNSHKSRLLCVLFLQIDVDSSNSVSSTILQLKPYCNISIIMHNPDCVSPQSQNLIKIIKKQIHAIDEDILIMNILDDMMSTSIKKLIKPELHKHITHYRISRLLSLMKLSPVMQSYDYVWMLDRNVSFTNISIPTLLSTYLCPSASQPPPPIIAHPLVAVSGNVSMTARYLLQEKWQFMENNTDTTMQEVRYLPLIAPIINSQYLQWYLKSIIIPTIYPLLILDKVTSWDLTLCTSAREFIQLNNDKHQPIMPCAMIINGASFVKIHTPEREYGYRVKSLHITVLDEILQDRYAKYIDYGASLEDDPLFPNIVKKGANVLKQISFSRTICYSKS